MKILVTGGRGFLGRFLIKKLLSLGHEVISFSSAECDLTNNHSLHRFINERFHQIVHLAAWTQAGDFCLHHAGEQWVINQKINTNVLDFWHLYQPQAKMICMGTSCSYAPDLPLIEENYLMGLPIDSLYSYAMTKRMLLVGLQSLHKQFGLEYLYLIPSTLYGPDYHTGGKQMHFIFDLIRKIVAHKETNEPVILWGNGEQKRELIHVEDFIDALLYLSATQKNCHINIGGGKEYSIREFAQLLCKKVHMDSHKILYDTTRYVGALSKVLSISLLQSMMPHFSPRPIDLGLSETVDWWRHNKPMIAPNEPKYMSERVLG